MTKEDLGLTKVLPAGIAGALVSGVVLYLGYSTQTAALENAALTGGTPDTLLAEILTIGGVLLGGFVAAHIAKGGKENLTKCLSASFISGLLVSLASLAMIVMTPEEALLADFELFYEEIVSQGITVGEEIFSAWMLQQLGIALILAGVFMVLSLIGGLACALATGYKESKIIDVYRKTTGKLSVDLVVPPLVFLALAFGLDALSGQLLAGLQDETSMLIVTLVSWAGSVALVSFALTAIINGTRKAQELSQAFGNAVKESKHVFGALIAFYAIAPMVIVFGISLIESLPLWSSSINVMMFFIMLMAVALAVYMFFVSFVAQAARTDGSYLRCGLGSVEFIKDNVLFVLSFYLPIFVAIGAAMMVLSYLPLGDFTMAVVGLAGALIMVFTVSGQTVLYDGVKK